MSKPKKTTPKPDQEPKPTMGELNLRQMRFCAEYMRLGNASESARRSGYSLKTAGAQGFVLLRNPKILAHIKAQWDALAMTEQEIVGRLSQQARASMDDVATETGKIRRGTLKKHGHLIRKLKRTKDGIEVELHDSQSALAHLAKIRGLFTEQINLGGNPGGEPVKFEFAHPADEVVHNHG